MKPIKIAYVFTITSIISTSSFQPAITTCETKIEKEANKKQTILEKIKSNPKIAALIAAATTAVIIGLGYITIKKLKKEKPQNIPPTKEKLISKEPSEKDDKKESKNEVKYYPGTLGEKRYTNENRTRNIKAYLTFITGSSKTQNGEYISLNLIKQKATELKESNETEAIYFENVKHGCRVFQSPELTPNEWLEEIKKFEEVKK